MSAISGQKRPELIIQNSTASLIPQIVHHILITCIYVAIPCDAHGNPIPEGTPPPPRDSDTGADDWTPYGSRDEFELADFLFRESQMSAPKVNRLLDIWAASMVAHGGTPPFTNCDEMYRTIDATPLGDVPWQSFHLNYNGEKPDDDIPSWMTDEHEVFFRDPSLVVKNMLANPDFAGEFDYVPFQERDDKNNHRFEDFMSGNWAWKQAVSAFIFYYQVS